MPAQRDDMRSLVFHPPLSQDLQDFLHALATDSSLFEPQRLRDRLDALDTLDARLGAFEAGELSTDSARVFGDAQAIRSRLEAANYVLYESIRTEIARGAPPEKLLHWLRASASADDTASPVPGLGYDHCDDLVSGVLQLREPGEPHLQPLPEMVFYQPTPVRHILHLITATALSKDDVFVDLGSGLGHVALLLFMLAGAQSVGIEIEPAYVASARACAHTLRLSGVRFLHEDARAADLSNGTVFYLYTPFSGSILAAVLHRLRNESARRPIRIGSLGPCTASLSKESWLEPAAPPDPMHISVFRSRS